MWAPATSGRNRKRETPAWCRQLQYDVRRPQLGQRQAHRRSLAATSTAALIPAIHSPVNGFRGHAMGDELINDVVAQ